MRSDQTPTDELTGRVVDASGDLAAFVCVSVGVPGSDDEATRRARRALAEEFADDPDLTLVDRHGDEVIGDA